MSLFIKAVKNLHNSVRYNNIIFDTFLVFLSSLFYLRVFTLVVTNNTNKWQILIIRSLEENRIKYEYRTRIIIYTKKKKHSKNKAQKTWPKNVLILIISKLLIYCVSLIAFLYTSSFFLISTFYLTYLYRIYNCLATTTLL